MTRAQNGTRIVGMTVDLSGPPPVPKAGARVGKCLAFKTNAQAAALSKAGAPMRGTVCETRS